ncbi:beta strand repeat-containing protein [Flavobacterium sp.]|uniref:beta strand repeat-containing protein n=1 Tax=Flavobacterium sp. TaxID=239 RepID=UPI003D0E89F9
MKKILTLFLLLVSGLAIGQAPNKMSYQAVIRDASNNLLTNTLIGTKVSVLQGSSAGTVVYSETHTTSTNTNGLITLEVGTGAVVSGTFSSIDWSTGNYYIKTETDSTGGSNYTISGISQLLSVPYALYANSSGASSGDNLGNHTATQNINIGTNYISDDGTNKGLKSDGNGLFNFTEGYTSFGNGNNTTSELALSNTSGINWFIGANRFTGNYAGAFTIGGQISKTFVIYNGNSNDLLSLRNSNVGIGLNNPTEKLEVNGKTKTTNFQMTNGATNGYLLQSDASGNATWVNPNVTSGTSTLTSNYIPKWNGTVFENSLLNQSDDRLFLGTETLFNGDFNYSRFTIASNDEDRTDFNNILATNTKNAPWINWGKARGTLTAMQSVQNGDDLFLLNSNGYDGTNFKNTASIEVKVDGSVATNSIPSKITFKTTQVGANNSTERLTINNIGNIGVGTTTPTEKFEVNGKIKATEFQLTNGSSNGFVLQSDASGNGIWVNPTSLSNGNWTINGTDQYNALSGNVGIGTTSPTYKLDIQSDIASPLISSIQSSGAKAYFSTTSPSTNEAAIKFNTYVSSSSQPSRWILGKGQNNETGSNSGADFFINRYDDSGNYNGQPLSISRANGTVTIGNNAPSTTENTLKINGSVATAVATKSSNYTFTGTDYCVIFTGTSASTFTLPSASSCTGRIYLIVNQGSVALTTSTYRTAIATTATSIAVGASVQIISDGTEWRKIN